MKNPTTFTNVLRKFTSGARRIIRSSFSSIERKVKVVPGLLERERIACIPHKQTFTTKFLNKKITVSDSEWYLPTLHEIWEKHIYKFITSSEVPLIIDCGANIGLSVLFWKYLYPTSRVIAYEPDPSIFQLLEKNISQFNITDVKLINAAVWTSETVMNFFSDNSVGGRLIQDKKKAHTIPVKTIRLKDRLDCHIDMLKIDIEGAEYEVILDCKDLLINIDHLFIEYHGFRNEKQKLHEILSILTDTGFRYHLLDANPIMHPFIPSERFKYFDLQVNIFAFRE